MIVVFDASSLVGAALRTGGVPETALLTVIDQGTLVVSREVVAEYRAVLRRPKFARAISAERRERILEFIEVVARRVEPVEQVADCRDPDDNRYLALAAASSALLYKADRVGINTVQHFKVTVDELLHLFCRGFL